MPIGQKISSRRTLLKQTSGVAGAAALAFHSPAFAAWASRSSSNSGQAGAPNFDDFFLSGPYAPVNQDQTLMDLRVTGEIPADLRGTFLRNGPDPLFPPDPYHWFDGDGMLHGVELESARAHYFNRIIPTAGYLADQAAGRSVHGGLMAPGPRKNSANTSVLGWDNNVFALQEGGLPHRVHGTRFAEASEHNFDGQISHPVSAHPKVCPETGDFYAFGYSIGQNSAAHCSVLQAGGALRQQVSWNLPYPTLIHEFLLTPNFAVVPVFPLVPDESGRFSLNKDLPTLIGVARRDNLAEIVWCAADPVYAFHFFNAYEQGTELIIDACVLSDFDVYDLTSELNVSKISRFTVNPQMSRASLSTTFPDLPLSADFPSVPPARRGQSSRYGICTEFDRVRGQSLLTIDFESLSTQRYPLEQNQLCGEVVLHQTSPENCYALNMVHNVDANTAELQIFRFTELNLSLIAQVHIPTRVPLGFHGTFLQEGEVPL